MNHTTRKLLINEAQKFANKRYAITKNQFNGYFPGKFSDSYIKSCMEVANEFPSLTNDEIHQIVWEASVYYNEQD